MSFNTKISLKNKNLFKDMNLSIRIMWKLNKVSNHKT